MKTLQSRLAKLELQFKLSDTAPSSKFTDDEKAEIAILLREIQGYEYSNATGKATYKYPDGFIQFRSGKVWRYETGELFDSLAAAQRKHPGIQVIPADAGLTEKLSNILKKEAAL